VPGNADPEALPPAAQSFYWNNNNNCSFLRQHIGDRATAIVQEIIGVRLIAMGIVILLKLE
jgi:hypothetical protein